MRERMEMQTEMVIMVEMAVLVAAAAVAVARAGTRQEGHRRCLPIMINAITMMIPAARL